MQSLCCYILAIWYQEDVFIVLLSWYKKRIWAVPISALVVLILWSLSFKNDEEKQNIFFKRLFQQTYLTSKSRTVVLLLDIRQNIYFYDKPIYKHSKRDQSSDHQKRLHRGDSILQWSQTNNLGIRSSAQTSFHHFIAMILWAKLCNLHKLQLYHM